MNIVARCLPPIVVAAGFVVTAKWLVPGDEPTECKPTPAPVVEPLDWAGGNRLVIETIQACYREWKAGEPKEDVRVRLFVDRNVRATHVAGPSAGMLLCLDPIKHITIDGQRIFEFEVTMSSYPVLTIHRTEHHHPLASTFYDGDFQAVEASLANCFATHERRINHEVDIRARARLSVNDGKIHEASVYTPEIPSLQFCLAVVLENLELHRVPPVADVDIGIGWIGRRVVIDARTVAERTRIQ